MTPRVVHLRITGAVQGVGYRDWMMRQAFDLALCGWVRNRNDGSVEAVASGEAGPVGQLIKACHRGPAMARVEAVAVTDWTEPVGDSFEFLQTD